MKKSQLCLLVVFMTFAINYPLFSQTFTKVTDNFNSINVGVKSAPTLIDIDGDGLLDLLIGSDGGNIFHYEQDAVNSTSFTLITTPLSSIDVGGRSAPTFADIDGDGLLGLFIGEYDGNINYYEQDDFNSNSFSLITSNFNGIDIGIDATPAFTDLDGDNLFDLLVGANDGKIRHYEQDSEFSDNFSLVSSNFNGIDVYYDSSPTFTDIDNDGLLDLLIGSTDQYAFYAYIYRYEQITGSPETFTLLSNNFSNTKTSGSDSSPVFTDLDGDGQLDLLFGMWEGEIHHWESNTATINNSCVTTSGPGQFMGDMAVLGGEVTDINGHLPYRGICYSSTNPTPTLADLKVGMGSGMGPFSGTVSGLNPNTTYYYRAFASSSLGTFYGDVEYFFTLSNGTGTPSDPFQIATLQELEWLSNEPLAWSYYFIQTADIDASLTSTWNGGEGFNPIGNSSTKFIGSYNGQGFVIDNLYKNSINNESSLFGYTNGATISNLGVTNVSISGNSRTSGLVGYNTYSTITNCYTSGNITGYWTTAGLVGRNEYSNISNCFSTANINATGNHIGGLVGANDHDCTITNCYSSGNVICFDNQIGGLVGTNTNNAEINLCYSTGNVSGGTSYIGGLVGRTQNGATTTNSFWDTETSGQATSTGGTAKSTVEMKTQSTFTDEGWDFVGETINGTDDIWDINTAYNNGYPFFSVQGFLPTVTTTTATAITPVYASSGGEVTDDGNATVIARGVCWNTSANPTTNNSHTNDGTGTGVFVSGISGLTPGTEYHYRAYVTNSAGTSYGDELVFTTLDPNLPTVSTTAATSITPETAISGGDVTHDGYAAVTARGVCWSTSPNPTAGDSHTTDGTGTGVFVSDLTGLVPATEYHYRAYATNSIGTNYGDDLIFTTPVFTLPTVTTDTATSISYESAISGGEVTDNGFADVTARGLCWGTSPNPTINDSLTNDGAGNGTFVSELTGLTAGTLYHYRAYATNTEGTGYGEDLIFSTLDPNLPIVTTTTATSITNETAAAGGVVTDDGYAAVTARGVCWSTTPNPTINDSFTEDGTGIGTFTSNIIGLNPSTFYYYRSYATNTAGTNYGEELTFTSLMAGSGSGADPYQVAILEDLRWISENNLVWDSNFIQVADINAGDTENWNGGEGFSPIGNSIIKFSGSYDGQGFVIDSLFINRPGSYYQGLSGYTNGVSLSNLGLTNINVVGSYYIAGFVGYANNNSQLNNCYTTGTINGEGYVGGLVGESRYNTSINSCYSLVNVNGNGYVGGLVGINSNNATINNCYSAGSVSGTYGGGLVGLNYINATINNCYSVGSVSGTNDAGGLVCESNFLVYNSFWDTETSGQTTSDGGEGKTTLEMQSIFTYLDAGWDFVGESTNGTEEIWNMYSTENNGYPYLSWQYDYTFKPLVITDNPVSVLYFTATLSGQVAISGGEDVTARGICWSTSPAPGLNDSFSEDGTGLGEFTSEISGLSVNTFYFYRAYATNANGTAYGDEKTFNTLDYGVPSVETFFVDSVSQTSAVTGGDVTLSGGYDVTARGVCWSTSPNPTINDSYTNDGIGTGEFSSQLTGLMAMTEYYYRAYATNSLGSGYGEELTFSTTVAGYGTTEDPFQISNLDELRWLSENPYFWYANFIQTADIDAAATSSWNNGEGFSPIGNDEIIEFSGTYNGQGFVIDNLYINRPDDDYQGLFGYINEATISNLGVTNTYVNGFEEVGGLAGSIYESCQITRCYTSGSITGNEDLGGLAGSTFYDSQIYNCYSSANVDGYGYVGGLIGYNYDSEIAYCHSSGNVTGVEYVGALVAYSENSYVENCYSTGSVTGEYYSGGLIGTAYSSDLENCFSTASVVCSGYIAGGLIGETEFSFVENCYSAGSVSCPEDAGGLIGNQDGPVDFYNSFWDTETSGLSTSAGGIGKTTLEMKNVATFTDTTNVDLDYPWDFAGNPYNDAENYNYWDINGTENNGYPFLIDDIIVLDIQVYLEVPFQSPWEMHTSLAESGSIPLIQPFNTAPWNYTGIESVDSIPEYIVDWVLVEFHDATNAASVSNETLIGRQAAFLDSWGYIVTADNSYNEIVFNHSFNQSLFVIIYHRNHLPVLSATPIFFNWGYFNYEFPDGPEQAYNSGQKDLGNGYFGMIAGDANADGVVDAADKALWQSQTGKSGYLPEDFNMDGQVDNQDKNNFWLPNYSTSGTLPE